MSFDTRFDARWLGVLAPAIRAVQVNGRPLDPHRVDLRKVSDSILTEILDGIARCRVFIADLTSVGEINGRPVPERERDVQRSAWPTRYGQAEEVLLFRSDDRDLLFDITQRPRPSIRSGRITRDGTAGCHRGNRSVTPGGRPQEESGRTGATAESLDYHSWMTLLEAHGRPFHHPATRTMEQALGAVARAQAIGRLLEAGCLRAEFAKVTPDLLKDQAAAERLVTYAITSLGSAVAAYGIKELGLFEPGIRESLEAAFGDAAEEGRRPA